MNNGPGEEYEWKVRKLRIVTTTGNSGLIVSNGVDRKIITSESTPAKWPALGAEGWTDRVIDLVGLAEYDQPRLFCTTICESSAMS